MSRGSETPHDVFISYSSHDKPIADATCAALEARKIRCWIAPRDVLPGVPYAEALAGSQVLVLILSAGANQSAHVMREVEAAASAGMPVIPFRVEDVQPSKSLHYFLRAIHWLDALTPPLEKHLRTLADTTLLLLSRLEILDHRQSKTSDPSFRDRGDRPARALSGVTPTAWRSTAPVQLTIAIAVAVVGLVAVAGWVVVRSGEPPIGPSPAVSNQELVRGVDKARRLEDDLEQTRREVRDVRKELVDQKTLLNEMRDKLARSRADEKAGKGDAPADVSDLKAQVMTLESQTVEFAQKKLSDIDKLAERISRLGEHMRAIREWRDNIPPGDFATQQSLDQKYTRSVEEAARISALIEAMNKELESARQMGKQGLEGFRNAYE